MQAGLMNTYQHPISSRQTMAWFLSGLLTLSYLLLYLGPIPALGVRWDVFQAGAEAVGLKSKWTLYGFLYTLASCAACVISVWTRLPNAAKRSSWVCPRFQRT